MTNIMLTVKGTPQPKGNKTPITRNGKTWLIESSKHQKDYEKQVILQILNQLPKDYKTIPKPNRIDATIFFRLKKPKHPKYEHPVVKPDIDKLIRIILDAGTNAKLWEDDSQITHLSAEKIYVTDEPCTIIFITDEKRKIL